MAITLTLTRSLTGYELGSGRRVYSKHSLSEVSSMISKLIEPGAEGVVVTITIERREKAKRVNKQEGCSFGAGI